ASSRARLVTKLGVKDRMWLLPDEQRSNRRRTVAPFWSNHLGPTSTAISLRAGQLGRARKYRFIPAQASLKQRQTVPQGKVSRVPPVHFQMKLAVPTVNGQSGFLWRHTAGTLNRGEVLRQHDSSLELDGALVFTISKFDRSTVRPEAFPVSFACSNSLSRRW